jgi:hypothetical protein
VAGGGVVDGVTSWRGSLQSEIVPEVLSALEQRTEGVCETEIVRVVKRLVAWSWLLNRGRDVVFVVSVSARGPGQHAPKHLHLTYSGLHSIHLQSPVGYHHCYHDGIRDSA